MKSAGLVLAAILLFLVVAVDFTGWLMSVLADGVLVAMVTVLLWPLLRNLNKQPTKGICGYL